MDCDNDYAFTFRFMIWGVEYWDLALSLKFRETEIWAIIWHQDWNLIIDLDFMAYG